MKYCRIDLHRNNREVVMSGDTNHMVYSKRHSNEPSQILAVLAPHRQLTYLAGLNVGNNVPNAAFNALSAPMSAAALATTKTPVSALGKSTAQASQLPSDPPCTSTGPFRPPMEA